MRFIRSMYSGQLPFKLPRDRGQVLLLAVLFVISGSLLVMAGVSVFVTAKIKTTTDLLFSKQSFLLADGALEEVVYREIKGKHVATNETLADGGVAVVTTVTPLPDNSGITVLSTGANLNRIRKVQATLLNGEGVAFSYGVQSDVGGVTMEQNAKVHGNLYSNGPVRGMSTHANVYGDVFSAGASGLIDKIQATGTARAHTITNSTIDRDAYYQTIFNTTWGTSHPNTPDLATTSLPISDEMVSQWENAASVTTISSPCPSGTYTISADKTFPGPTKIECNVNLSATITLSGVLWIAGNLNITSNQAAIIINPSIPSLAGKSIPLIVDNPANRLTSSMINLPNNTTFTGSGSHSNILLLSMNSSAEQGGGAAAIDIRNNLEGNVILYAGHGLITTSHNADYRAVTAWRINLGPGTELTYDSGLANTLFTMGPSGGYELESIQEVAE